jgi:succinate dehydrogenase / fumarate reductase, cytochrome b subunit
MNRPRYLNLFQIHLFLPGWVSILHRISGVLLVLSLPAGLLLFQTSLKDQAGYEAAKGMLSHPISLLMVLLLLWSLLHHLLSGLRLLAFDLGIGAAPESARRSALWVLVSALVAAILVVGTW